MFLLLLLVVHLNGLQAGQHPQKTILQTTVPEKISSPDVETDPENHMAYLITINENPHFIHLKKQSFITSTAVSYTYDRQDVRHSQSLSSLKNCNYNGYVAGFPNSIVSLTVCSGLRGMIQFENVSYGIEPVETLSGFIHVIYENTNQQAKIPDLGENQTYSWSDELDYQFRSNMKKSGFAVLRPRYIKTDIVVDKKLFDYMGSDTRVVLQKVIQIIGFINTMFSKLKLTVLINSVEIWSKENRIDFPEAPENLLVQFLHWKHKYRPQHISYLLAFVEHPASTGALYPGNLCKPIYGAAIALYPKGLSLESYSVIVLQLLSIGIGLTYDNADSCHCTGDVCLMTPKAIYSGGVKDFSTCSLDDFKYLSTQDLECLQDLPMERQKKKPSRPRRICGNGILEMNEQCDCGTLKNCTHKKCCDPMSCRLKSKAVCGSGECCGQDCKVKPVNVLCRKSKNECDFEEYCNGNDAYCVPDTFARNGQYCDSGQAFCYSGLCMTSNNQCMNLLGKYVRGASFACYEEFNSRNDRFGNCIRKFCSFENSLCGKLVCTWPFKRLLMKDNMSAAYGQIRDDLCISLYKGGRPLKTTLSTYSDMSERDETFVKDGTICGPDMFCLETQCKETRFLVDFQQCNTSRDCNDHGVCNNFNHCHCDKGYNPPYCESVKGQFGSIDDGHKYYIDEGKSAKQQNRGIHPKQQLQLILYITLPLIMIISAVFIKQSKLSRLCGRERSEGTSCITEDSVSNTKMTTNEGSTLH
ncbi:disintegrin and metalloproteinase domain-containing protein 5 isoform X2 [Rattus norvegicus]|uniref:Disintegrin and metalloproteinase domain-containing protein 5 n=3 Tax=Rattus norvegicus TaxID=10116 RepID=A0A140TAH8_RAT|nr:disintegrin and metalloproteinase domain-containing protein 5 isoform X2 [Rattus norvegicus]|eukprot:XP_006253384.1 PREDICTED: disintegrin and metalloproteinase domain-containing protein 5 isoform X2 [Rattus norvegicus]